MGIYQIVVVVVVVVGTGGGGTGGGVGMCADDDFNHMDLFVKAFDPLLGLYIITITITTSTRRRTSRSTHPLGMLQLGS